MCMLKVYYFIYSTLHEMSWHYVMLQVSDQLYFKSICWGYSKKKSCCIVFFFVSMLVVGELDTKTLITESSIFYMPQVSQNSINVGYLLKMINCLEYKEMIGIRSFWRMITELRNHTIDIKAMYENVPLICDKFHFVDCHRLIDSKRPAAR